MTLTPYRLLPFRFERKRNTLLLINDVGDYYFINEEIFQRFIKKELSMSQDILLDLQSKFMLCTDNLSNHIELLATRYRTKKRNLFQFTSLHMIAITKRCNQQCSYCHASSIAHDSGVIYDMNVNTARKCVDLIFCSPSPHIKIEFQGGEPVLNFTVIKDIVSYATDINKTAHKRLEFVLCTNLTNVTREHIEFIKSNNILISTSLDGPHHLHDKCRILRSGKGSYNVFLEKLSLVRDEMGINNISALMTTTPYNIKHLKDVVDEYVKLGLPSIFIRTMNSYGYASNAWDELGYSDEEFILAYKEVLDYIIELNISGIHFPEEFATLLLSRIMTPFSDGFVDLQSPTGAGIGGVIYDFNGDVYISDEARMLASMNGDKTFSLGNVHHNSWKDMFNGEKLRNIITATCIESLPGCAWCAFQPYCGTDPVRNHIQFGSYESGGSKSMACKKNKAIFNLLFDYLEAGNGDVQNVFWSWITNRNLRNIRIN